MMKTLVVVMIALAVVQALDCSKHRKCPATHTIRPNRNTDYSACLTDCPKCLVGPEWDARLKAMGKGDVARTFSPRFYVGDWLSAEIISTIASILAQDTMGFKVDNLNNSPMEASDILCCPEPIINLEAWSSSSRIDGLDSHPEMTSLQIGYNGQSGLFVSKASIDKYPMMTAWTSYKYLPSYSSILPRAFSTPCEDFRINESLPCREDNYPCRASVAWNGLGPECVKGRYVPPQCMGEKAKYCQEIYAPDPEWDLGFFRGSSTTPASILPYCMVECPSCPSIS